MGNHFGKDKLGISASEASESECGGESNCEVARVKGWRVSETKRQQGVGGYEGVIKRGGVLGV